MPESATPARGTTVVADGVARAPRESTWRIATPLTPVGYYPKSGVLPAVTEVRDQSGKWDAPGQTRRLMLSDGGSVIETTLIVKPVELFVYELTGFQKFFGAIVDHARAEWTFGEVAGGTSIHWTYTYVSRGGLARPTVALIVRLAWGPYMRRVVLPRIIAEVERQAGVSPAP